MSNQTDHGKPAALRISQAMGDSDRDCGLFHFAGVWGQTIADLVGDTVSVVFDEASPGGTGESVLRVEDGRPGTNVVGHFVFEGIEWPIFTTPSSTGPIGRPLLEAKSGSSSKPIVWEGPLAIHLGFDIFRDIGRTLRGDLASELIPATVGDAGTVPPPIVDGYERLLASLVMRKWGHSSRLPHPIPWPKGSPFAVVLTHDVDRVKKTFQYVTHAWRGLRRMDLQAIVQQTRSLIARSRGREPYWTFERILRLERAHDASSVFFFLNEPSRISLTPRQLRLYTGRYHVEVEPVASLVKDLVAREHEVGLHASYHSIEDPRLLAHDKRLLERIAERDVLGVRQHYFRLQGSTTWQHQVAAGFVYDCSVGSSRAPGFIRGTLMPFRPWPRGASAPLDILEIPTTMVDTAVLYESMVTLRPRRHAEDVVRAIIQYAEYTGGVLNVLWHSHLFSEEDYPGATDFYDRILLECSKRGAWFIKPGQLCSWWQEHTTHARNPAIEFGRLGSEKTAATSR